jgi:hypothetical protein
VEVDGSQHLNSTSDAGRDAALDAAGFRVLRFWNNDVLDRIDEVLQVLLARLNEGVSEAHHPHPDPLLEGEGEEQADPFLERKAGKRAVDEAL